MKNYLLTPEENEAMEKLAEAYNAFAALPVIHPLDKQEFIWGIHICQMIIHSRPSLRAEGVDFIARAKGDHDGG